MTIQRTPEEIEGIYNTLVNALGIVNRPTQLDFMKNLYFSLFQKPVVNFNESPTGCHAKGQEILMYNGTCKKVEDIKIGDLLMGPDSTSREVLALCRGTQQMAEVVPVKGDSFIVNIDHILSLKTTNEGKQYGITKGNIVNLPIAKYISKTKYFKHVHKLYRTGVDFSNDIALTIPPYILGIWLGDGDSHRTAITTIDEEIKTIWLQFATSIRMGITKYTQKETNAISYHITNGGDGRITNPLHKLFKKLNVIKNKHIPLAYKTASRTDRLALLAGIIDTDGTSSDGGYDIIFKSKQLALDTVYVARSLGLAAYIKPCKKSSQNGTEGLYYRIFISGDCSVIPVTISRKKIAKRLQKKDVLVTGFTIKLLKEDAYYGFTLNKDNLYLLNDFTVTHNTGKTFAYLIPAFIYAYDNPAEKIILSTKSLTLQEQIIKHDIPVLQKFFAEQSMPNVKVAVFKGRNNYVCGFRAFKENARILSSKKEEIEGYIASGGGEKTQFQEAGWTFKEWKRIETLDSRECLKRSCLYWESKNCCYMTAKAKAKEANIIIVNHYLVFADLWNRSRALPNSEPLIPIAKYTNIIFDEAHLMEDIITKSFTLEYTDDMIAEKMFSLKHHLITTNDGTEEQLIKTSGELTKYIKGLEGDAVPPTDKLHKLVNNCIEACKAYISFLVKATENKAAQGVEAKIKLAATINQMGDIVHTLSKVVYRDTKKYVVHKDKDILKVTVIDYQDILEACFFNPEIAVNMVSATLSFQGQFFYPLKTLFLDKILGIRPTLLGKVYAPVFAKKQAEFITPLNLVDYRDEKYEKQLAHITKTLVAKNNGSALLLFTSIKRMRSIYDVLLAEDLPYTLLIPDENTSKLDLIHKFKKDVSSVLFGSYSFWEGIDVPGESLTLIIIDKLPFETPTELSKALSEKFGGFQYQCYKTTLKLKQGIGRLIRSETDTGKIIICDNRLHSTSWGKLIYNNLQ